MFAKAHKRNRWKKRQLGGQARCLSSPGQTETITNDTEEWEMNFHLVYRYHSGKDIIQSPDKPIVLMPPSEICDYVRTQLQVHVLCHKCQPASFHQFNALHALSFERRSHKKLNCRIFPSASFFHVRYSFLIFSHLCYLLAEAAPFMEFNKWCLPSEQFDSSSNYSNKLLSWNVLWVFHYFKLLSSILITETVDLFWEASSCKFSSF